MQAFKFYDIWTSHPAFVPDKPGYRVSVWLTQTRAKDWWNRCGAAGVLIAPIRTGLLLKSDELRIWQDYGRRFARALNVKRIACYLLGMKEGIPSYLLADLCWDHDLPELEKIIREYLCKNVPVIQLPDDLGELVMAHHDFAAGLGLTPSVN